MLARPSRPSGTSNLDEALAGVLGEDEYISGRTFDSEGNLYVVTASKIYALDPQIMTLTALSMAMPPIASTAMSGYFSWSRLPHK